MKSSTPFQFKITVVSPLIFLLLTNFNAMNASWIISFFNDSNLANDEKVFFTVEGTSLTSMIWYQWALQPATIAQSKSAKAT
jgi:hypothetical protein